MTNSKLSRRKALFLVTGVSALITSIPVYAQKKKRSRGNRRYYPDKDYSDYNNRSSPSPTPAATPAPPEKYSPPHPALIPAVGGGIFSLFGVVGAWFWKINHKVSKTLETSSPSTNRGKTIDPIEQELNQMKFESGMNRAKSVRRVTSAPDPSEWYVFRSGKAEGPYTKLQLFEIQKITDRTKVRLGEAEWQRAGEIPELAKFLTQK